MRRFIISGCLAVALLLGAGAAGAEVLRDTLMLRAKDSQAKVVSIGGEIFHLTPETKLVSGGLGSRSTLGQALTLADLPVPETKGAVVPKGEPGVRVKYEAVVNGDHKELVKAIVFPKGKRQR